MTALWPRIRDRRGVNPHRDAQVTVVLASAGSPISDVAIDRALSLADGGAVSVVSIAKVHGSAFGLPNPGLLPTRREKEEQRTIVGAAVDALENRDITADGQVIVTRNAGRAIARLARARGARYVVFQAFPQGWLRRLLEGDPARTLRRANGTTLVLITDQPR
ncbi:MAG TPA: universal stress protein [Pseudonocardia sp.]|jgi:nucleotide-binding universal stress UspA family protein|nr:universal stress protein [Pseudonocardia sp.]